MKLLNSKNWTKGNAYLCDIDGASSRRADKGKRNTWALNCAGDVK
jgi:hypothetical protein